MEQRWLLLVGMLLYVYGHKISYEKFKILNVDLVSNNLLRKIIRVNVDK